MGIFTRFRDIISSNINTMLDKAEDPDKLIRLMIHEMEDTLVEIKSSCAGAMAACTRIKRRMSETRSRETYWEDRAKLAVRKGRDDLAREALVEKRRYTKLADQLGHELSEHNTLVEKYQSDIRQLENKLGSAREKQRILVQRHIHARGQKRVQQEIRRMDSADAVLKFDHLENRIERMEAEADLVNFGKKPSLEEKLDELIIDDEVEKELNDLKSSATKE